MFWFKGKDSEADRIAELTAKAIELKRQSENESDASDEKDKQVDTPEPKETIFQTGSSDKARVVLISCTALPHSPSPITTKSPVALPGVVMEMEVNGIRQRHIVGLGEGADLNGLSIS